MERSEQESTSIEVEETSREIKDEAPLLGTSNQSARDQKGYKSGIGVFDLIARISAATASLTATITMGTSEQTLPFFTQFVQFQASFDNLPSFTFFVIAMSMVTGYLVLSIPFSIFSITVPGPRLLLILCDTLTVILSTSASASSAAIVYLARNGNSDANWPSICGRFDAFCRKTSGAVVASVIAAALTVIMVMLSALALRRS